MPQTLTQELGIWGNEKCMQCGACCYDYNKDYLCRYQEIRDGKSYCSMHENPQRDLLCQNWHCSDLDNILNNANRETIQQRFRDIAKSLGTALESQGFHNFNPSIESSKV